MPGEPGKFWQFKRFLARRMFHPYLVVTRDGVHIHGTSGTYLVQDHQELKPVAFEQRVVPVAEFEAKCVLHMLPVQRLQTQPSHCTTVWLQVPTRCRSYLRYGPRADVDALLGVAGGLRFLALPVRRVRRSSCSHCRLGLAGLVVCSR